MKQTKFLALVLCVVFVSLTMGGCGPAAGEDDAFKVGFVYIGVPGDGGWTYAHEQGRLYMVDALGMKPQDTFTVENVPETADVETAIAGLVEKGCKLIFTTSFGFMDYTVNMANKYTDVMFEHCSGFMTADNMSNYFGRIHQGAYLAGIAAGSATTANKIGFVAAFPIPEVIRNINAFALGAQSVNPDVTVQVVWSQTWYDPGVEREAALSLIDAGVDVMAQHQDTPEPVKAAEAAGIYSTGYDSPMGQYAPEGYLTGANWNWGPYYAARAKAARDGEWTSHSYWGGFDDGLVVLDAYGKAVSQAAKDHIAAKQQALTEKTWDVFTGPLYRQDGTLMVEPGAAMTDAEQLAMDWLVKGVEGSVN